MAGGPFVLVRSTYGNEAAARHAARELVRADLATCVHVSRIDSTYRWKGELVEEPEWLLEARTLTARAEATAQAIREGHPYDEPLVEWIEVPWAAPGYVDWAKQA